MSDPLEQHRTYWKYEYDVTAGYMVPLLERWGVAIRDRAVIDVGCGEGGGVCALHDRGARCVGFDVEAERIRAAGLLKGDRAVAMTTGDLYASELPWKGDAFDLVVLHDVFEHLERKEHVLRVLKEYAGPAGHIMITFPPYYSAYGAHQQLLRWGPARMPFFHLIPFALSQVVPRLKDESPYFVGEVRKLGALKMGMAKFERLLRPAGLHVAHREAYLISPNHIRFGLTPVPAGPIARIPLVRELLCSGVVYLLGSDSHA